MNITDSPREQFEAATAVAIGLGTNVGDRVGWLRFGLEWIEQVAADLTVSAVFETEPRHIVTQPQFLNACCVGRTGIGPHELLAHLRAGERESGRDPDGVRYGPRPLDLDILLYGDLSVCTPDLSIPHPRLAERAFVLVPLSQIARDWRVPGSPDTVGDLADRVDFVGVRRLGLLEELERHRAGEAE